MHLTDRSFWLNYWENKEGLVFEVNDSLILTDILRDIVSKNSPKSSLEIGGFPGHYSIYLKKKFGISADILDFVIHPEILNSVCKINNVQDIGQIETDLFKAEIAKKYDFVFSNGLIEHFDNTAEIIQKHIDFLNDQGVLFLSLPNFRGINGWFQKKFDPENLSKHNLHSMNIDLLKEICVNHKLKNVQVNYHGDFMLWLENRDLQPKSVKVFMKTTWFVFKVFNKIFPLRNRLLSPYITVIAYK